jgi:periplasmic divalent cation tolerance protein
MNPESVLVVLVTVPPDHAERIAGVVVGEKLAACVNTISGLRSTYRWEAAVHSDAESLLVMKTTKDGFAALCRRVKEVHPYAVPEIIALPLAAGYQPYLDWVGESVG